MAAALLAFRLARAGGLRWLAAMALGTFALLVATIGTLGGLAPLLQGMSDVGFSVGKHRFSLLIAINSLIIVAILYAAARLANQVLHHLIGRASGLDAAQQLLVQKLAGIGVIVVAVLLGIDLLGLDLTALTIFPGRSVWLLASACKRPSAT